MAAKTAPRRTSPPRRAALGLAAALLASLPLAAPRPAAAAEPILGTWVSPPDNRAQTGHIEVRPCGARFCGTLTRAFSPKGAPITTPNVGKRLFWDMAATGAGHYAGGKVYVPLFGRSYPAEITVSGDRLRVRGCLGPVCQSQTWHRKR